MSSTRQKGNADDYYATPEWVVEEFIHAFQKHEASFEAMTILDPCCGGCEQFSSTYPDVFQRMFNIKCTTMDIREDSHADIIANYLHTDVGQQFDMICTNPPFSLSTDFASKAIHEVTEGGYVVMLQRLNWLGSKKRKPFWENMPLRYVFVHHKRPSFHGTKGTDSIEYAHFVFKEGYVGNAEIIVI